MRRAFLLLAMAALLAGLVWLRESIACCWDPGPSVRFNRIHAHSPLTTWEFDKLDAEPGAFLDADLVRQAYAKEEGGDLAGSLAILRTVEADAMRALGYRRADRFLLHPLDVARTRIRIASAAKEDAAPFLAACRACEEGRATKSEGRGAKGEGCPLAEEWDCLQGLTALPTDPAAARRAFEPWTSTRARWLLARAERAQGDLAAAQATLAGLRARQDLGTLADDVEAEVARCHVLAGELTQAARAYEGLLAAFPDGDMREEAEESLLYVVYPKLVKDGKEVPPGVKEYLDGLGCLLACGLAWDEYPAEATTSFEAALAKGPAWLRDNALYRAARCAQPKVAARRLTTLLKESPEGPFAPIAHYLLAQRDATVRPKFSAAWVLGPHLAANEAGTRNAAREWDHLSTVATRFPASQWAPADLALLLPLAEELDREDEAITAAACVFRAQPAGGDMPFAAIAMRRIQAWVKDGLVTAADVEKAGFLDRYLLETGQSRELIARCPESPFALRALADVLNGVEGTIDESTGGDENGWCAMWNGSLPSDYDLHPDLEDGAPPTPERPAAILVDAARVLDHAKGGDPRVVGLARVQLSRLRLAAGDAAGAREDAAEAVRLALDAKWATRAWEARGRADIALGRLEDAKEAKENLLAKERDSETTKPFRAELALALERAGDRVSALKEYCDINYEADTRYLAEVVCTTDELLAFHMTHPDYDPLEFQALLWRRLLAEGKWDLARSIGRAICESAQAGKVDADSSFVDLVDRLETACKQVEMCKAAADPTIAEEALRRVRELGADDWQVREAASQRLLEIGAPAAKAIQSGTASDDAEVRQRCETLLERIPSDPAVALYRWATIWFELGKDVYGEWGGDVKLLRFVSNFLSKDEGKQVEAFLEREHGLFRARRAYQEVADRYPTDPTAAKALYMVGVTNLRLYDVAGWYGVVGSQETLATRAREAFLALAQRFPKSPLADDGLFWASHFTNDPAAKQKLRDRIRAEYPAGDVAKVLFADGGWNEDPSEVRLQTFRAHNRALRQEGK